MGGEDVRAKMGSPPPGTTRESNPRSTDVSPRHGAMFPWKKQRSDVASPQPKGKKRDRDRSLLTMSQYLQNTLSKSGGRKVLTDSRESGLAT